MNRVSKLTDVDSAQQKAYIRLTELRDKREPINVVCPWGVLENYVITRLEFMQTGKTKDKTKITISFKQLRTTVLQYVEFNVNKYQGIEKLIRSPKVEKGQTTGSTKELKLGV